MKFFLSEMSTFVKIHAYFIFILSTGGLEIVRKGSTVSIRIVQISKTIYFTTKHSS